ncbi:MAG TPA: HAD family hydrolase [Myxococcota bacterium]|nr:HAD family hydrolase [Myxococcota bacterium]
MPIRAVFFDLGGTLFSYRATRPHFDRLLEQLARAHGIEDPFETVRARYREAMGAAGADYNARPYYLHRDMFRAAFLGLLRAYGCEARDSEALYDGQSEVGARFIQLRRGVRETLAALRARGLHLGVVSNIDDDLFRAIWASLGIGPLFDATTTSEEARSCKPDSAIYQAALAKAPGVSAAEVLFVGDSPQHDFAGAKPLGMRTVWITERPTELSDGLRPDHVIREIPELLRVLGE